MATYTVISDLKQFQQEVGTFLRSLVVYKYEMAVFTELILEAKYSQKCCATQLD